MKKLFYFKPFIAILAITTLIFVACEKESPTDMVTEDLQLFDEAAFNKEDILNSSESSKLKTYTNQDCGEMKVYPLIASQYYWAGALVVWNDSENLYVKYWSWLPLSEFHLFVGNIEDMPVNKKGNPKIGQFPYSLVDVSETSHTFVIPLANLPECPDIAAHAVFRDHTIWAKDCSNPKEFDGTRWGWWLEDQCTEECESPEKVIAAKVWLLDTLNNDPAWAVLYDSDYALGEDCGFITPAPANEDNTWSLVDRDDYNVVLGTVSLTWNGTSGEVLITPNEGIVVKRSHMFYGTMDEFNSYMNDEGCPEYTTWPYLTKSWSGWSQHVYNIEK